MCVGEILSLLWFYKELKNDLSKNMASSTSRSRINIRWVGVPFLIVLVSTYNLSLCHTPIKPDLLGFPGIGVFACGLRDHVITRFASRLTLTNDIHVG